MISYVIFILAMPSTQVECTASDIPYSDEKLFTCITAKLEMEDVWLESVHKCTEDSTTIVHVLGVSPVTRRSCTKMDFKSREVLLFLIHVHVQDGEL